MKKNLKKLSSLALAFVLVAALSLTALAADINAEQAKSIALENAGYSQSDALYLRAAAEYDDGIRYFDVSFAVKNADGSYIEYDYDIAVSSGRILEKDVDREYVRVPSAPVSQPSADAAPAKAAPAANADSDIGEEAAKKSALSYFGVNEASVKFIKVRKGYDDGVRVYDIEFCEPYEVKYSCDVVASSGAVVDVDKDVSRGFFDKLELFLEVLIAQILYR